MASRRRHLHRRKSWPSGVPITIRVGSRRAPRRFHEVQVAGPKDAGRFARLVEDQVRNYPRDPLIISVNGYQPWLEEIFSTCIEDYWSDISDLDREVQFASTMQFPEKASQKGQFVPWTFIIDHMNVPQVYYWSVDLEPPPADNFGLPLIENFRFRIGVWQMGQGAYLVDRNISVTIIFTKPTEVSELVVSEIMFANLYKDVDFTNPREDEEGICWIFIRLYWLLSDWQNIVSAITVRLGEAELNSQGRKIPVKWRARSMHHEIDRVFELKDYLQFHSRCFKKLQKLKDEVPKNEQDDPLWNDQDDAVEDLDQYGASMDSLKERLSNLIDLEFNIQNAVQADNSAYLSIVATLFLPVSFVASIFGISSVDWSALLYLYVSIPVLILSIIFTISFGWVLNKIQKALYPVGERRIHLQPRDFTLLGDELPGVTDVAGSFNSARTRKHATAKDNGLRTRTRSRSRLRSEKGD